jgi:hypothetical protein
MVSARQVEVTPMAAGLYERVILSRAVKRFSRPPKIAVDSVKFDEAISMGSRKWLIT